MEKAETETTLHPVVQECIDNYAKYYAEQHKLGMSIRSDMRYVADVATRWASDEEKQRDSKRLDWLEMLTVPSEDIDELVRNWRVNGKRYPTGLRDAIDAAMDAWPSSS